MISAATRKKIAKTYGVTPQAVGLALRYKRNSKQSEAMRMMAMENGGVVYEKAPKSPEGDLKSKNLRD